MRVSIGKGKYGAIDSTIDMTFDELRDYLQDASRIDREPEDKDEWLWITPMIQKAGVQSRRLEDIDRMSAWFGLDNDYGKPSIDTIRYKLKGLAVIVYTTANSRPDNQRWRIIIALNREYTAGEHDRLFRWFNHLFDEGMDVSCRNANRLHYLPAQWAGADNVFWCSDDADGCADVDAILAEMPALPEPPVADPQTPVETAPDGTPIITERMIGAVSAPVGGRLFGLMCMAAKRFRIEGWRLQAVDLAHAAMIAQESFSPGKGRQNVVREAERALQWAANNFAPQTKFQKIKARLAWEDARRKARIEEFLKKK